MFRPVVAIIRSLSFDTLKIILYNCVAACLMRRLLRLFYIIVWRRV